MFRLERTFGRDADIGRLFLAQLGQFHADLFQMQADDLFVQCLGRM